MSGVGLRERKKEATRCALITAATRLVAERGLDRVTVDDIADAAGVSVRTFFNYFAAKDDAVIGADPERVHELLATLAARPADEPPLDSLRAALTATLDRYVEQRDDWALRSSLVRQWPQLRARHMGQFEQLERQLIEAVADRMGADADRDVYPTLVVSVAVAALRAALRAWVAPGVTTPLADLVAEAFDGLAEGLPPPRRRRHRTT
ncbi:MAG: TetR family transcriptional regulator [Actinobacteria bacterium]|nr:TetR family transcriptional regulator [Actinomycetota bacterium]